MSKRFEGGGMREGSKKFSLCDVSIEEDTLSTLSQELSPANLDKKQDDRFFPVTSETQKQIESNPFYSELHLKDNPKDLETRLQRRKEKIHQLDKTIQEIKEELVLVSKKPPLWKRLLGLGGQQQAVYRRQELERKLKGLEHEYGWEMERYKFESGQLKDRGRIQGSQEFRKAA